MRIVVLGYVVRGPLGGMAWQPLQYAAGLARLGHDVYFLEDSDDYVSCFDPSRNEMDTDPSYGLQFAARAFERIGLGDRWAYHDAHTSRWLGPCADRMPAVCREADLCLNVAGVNPLRPWLEEIPARALVDTDPAFTQIRHLSDPAARASALGHTAFFTIAENVGRSGCAVPDDGLPWRRTRQPLVLDAWPVTPAPAHGRFTTVLQWDSYPALEYDGVRYGMKSASFLPYLDLPQRADGGFELVLPSAPTLRAMLEENCWSVRDPRRPTADPWSYQRYIQQSKAEFSVAKEGYAVSRSGWFSERTACYMASGRPALVQDTGFTDWLPAGSGVVPFTTPDEAVGGVEEINRRYRAHCRDARELAEEYFDARTVLSQLVESAVAPDRDAEGAARPDAPADADRRGALAAGAAARERRADGR